MKKYLFLLLTLLLILTGGIFYFGRRNLTVKENEVVPSGGEEETKLIGGDKDEHGCLIAAGYSWCEVKQKCLRPWEEQCEGLTVTPTIDETALLKMVIKQALVAKHGSNANELVVSVSKIEGEYAQGGASAEGGGGMWLASKVEGEWVLVWDGNGTISCQSFEAYPKFPTAMVPECYNEKTGQLVKR